MHDGVYLADIGQELVAQALALGRSLYQTRDVHELDDRRGHLGGMVHICQKAKPLVRHRHHAHVRVDGAERVIGGLCSCLCQRIKKGALSNIWKSHDSKLHSCRFLLIFLPDR